MTPVVFSAWMGPGDMTVNREAAFLTLVRNTGCAHAHITRDTLKDWIDPQFPLHTAFPYLSAVHQCDYLRCYLLHVYGGGYADIKRTSKSWRPLFAQLDASSAFGLGYTEIGPHGIARVGGDLEREMQVNYQRIVGVCAMIFRPRTQFTTEWHARLTCLLDSRMERLLENPAKHPQDRYGAQFTDGTVSKYPFEWTEVGGNVFHPLAYQYSSRILHVDIAPSFQDYR
jgi:hypothetical protein